MQRGCMRMPAMGSKDPEKEVDVAWFSPAATASIRARRVSIVSSSGRPELVLERQLPDAPARRGEDGVGEGGPGHGRARLADSARGFGVAHQMHLDRRGLVDAQD